MTNTHIPYLTLEIPPATEPLTLAEVKLYLRVDGSEENAPIARLIAVARKIAEQYTRRSLITQSWNLSYDEYTPSEVRLPKGPVQSVTSVKIIARDTSETVVSSSSYYLNAGKEKLVFDATPIGHSVEIIYVTGFGDSTAIPEEIKQGMLSHIAVLYENRIGEMPLSAASKALYDNHRIVRI